MPNEPTGAFDVVLTDAGSKKIGVIKVVREATGLGLKDAKAVVDEPPSVVSNGMDRHGAEGLKSKLEGLGAVAELRPSSLRSGDAPGMPAAVLAKFAPSFRSIKLYEDGQIEYQGHAGSIVGAKARVDSSGSKRVFRDTREVFLMIEGPRVSIAASLGSKGHLAQSQARHFAAKVNELAMRLDEAKAALASDVRLPAGESDVVDRLERLGRLRESGVLTEAEFQAQKSALLAD